MNTADIARQRLLNQRIVDAGFKKAGDVVAWMGAMQAQDYTGALWSIGLRMKNATEQQVEQAIANREFVRTWPLRGTLHFVAAADVRWMLALLTPRNIAQSAGRYRQLELDESTFGRSKEIFTRALAGGKHLTRQQLYQELEAAMISSDGQRGYHMLVRAAQDGLICFGVRQGKEQTFTLLDEWLPATKPLLRDEALAQLTLRYFTSHGPATLADLVRWAGITMTDARAGLAMVESQLLQESIDEQLYWFSSASQVTDFSAGLVYLLPGFDEYLLGYGDRNAVLDPQYANRICPGGNGVFQPTIVSKGQVVGTWKRAIKRGKVTVIPAPFTTLGKDEQSAFAAKTERYAQFLGLQINSDKPSN